MATSGSVTAVYELPRPIWVDLDILGKRFDTRIGIFQASVVTPTVTPVRAGAGAGPPRLDGIPDHALGPITGEHPPRLDAYPDNADVIDPEWATEYAAEYDGQATALRAIGIEVSESPDAPTHNDCLSAIGDADKGARYSVQGTPAARIADLVGRNIETWYTRLAEWVTVLTGQDLDHRHQLFNVWLTGPGLRVWHNNSWHITSTHGAIPRVMPIGTDDWTHTLHHIGDCKRPALEWQLLVQANGAAVRGYFRRAVLDYAIAVEVCLSRKVQNSASSMGKPGERSTLPKWSEWLTAHEPTYEADPDFSDLVDMRNAAAHRGIEPTEDQITSAARCAARIVNAHGAPRSHVF
ncbi:hypothetical protein [Rhodococcus opacus]|uniref:hypothetical protein n=1 Tax=Rhodococcus opacus TaxID=37919 RepID=UPI002476C55B|nr:hypothetical protein [Rhodococcus opacus]